jgi:hypothetical protein
LPTVTKLPEGGEVAYTSLCLVVSLSVTRALVLVYELH